MRLDFIAGGGGRSPVTVVSDDAGRVVEVRYLDPYGGVVVDRVADWPPEDLPRSRADLVATLAWGPNRWVTTTYR